uniref:Uncharacterized protein n=1 Tax=Cucumis melo TaxID=3656 RepID=A0A9I9EKY0_CUCME
MEDEGMRKVNKMMFIMIQLIAYIHSSKEVEFSIIEKDNIKCLIELIGEPVLSNERKYNLEIATIYFI